MFHVETPPHQTRITSFFKPTIIRVRKNQRNTPQTTKTQAPSLASPAALKREIPPPTLRKPVGWSFQRYVSGLPLKTASEKRFGNTLHTAPPTLNNVSSWFKRATPAQLEEVELGGGEKEAQKKHQLALLKAIKAVN